MSPIDGSSTPLEGILVAWPTPNKQGFWAYRQFPDGSLLEIQLTQSEWSALHKAETDNENAKIDDHNKHPLNVAALEVMRRAGEEPVQHGGLKPLYILALAELAIPDWDDDQSPALHLAEWTRSFERMERALLRLIDSDLAPRELESMSVDQASKHVLSLLGIELR